MDKILFMFISTEQRAVKSEMEIIYLYVTTQTNDTFTLITVVFLKQLLDWEKILNWLPTTTISCFVSRLVTVARLDRSCARYLWIVYYIPIQFLRTK